MSEKKKYGLARDDVRGELFPDTIIRECPHAAVIKRFGSNGKARVSLFTCQKCNCAVHYDMHGGISCGYREGEKM